MYDTSILYTSTEAAEYLGLHPDSLCRWRRLKRGPKFIRAGRFIRYRLDELESYLTLYTEAR